MRFKDVFLINEKKVTLDGKVFNSEKEAGFYLGSIGKNYKDIMSLLDVPERMAKWYANTWKKNWKNKPLFVNPPSKPDPWKTVPLPEPKTELYKKSPDVDDALQRLINQYKEPKSVIETTDTALPIVFDPKISRNLMEESGKQNEKLTTFLGFQEKAKRTSLIYDDMKDATFAIAVLEGKPVYSPEDIPDVPNLNSSLDETVKRISQNHHDDMKEAFKYLPQNMIDILYKSKTFNNNRAFIKSNAGSDGGYCKAGLYEIFWGKKYSEKSSGILIHEMMHMLDGSSYKISNKISKAILNADIMKMKAPSTRIEKKVDEILKKVEFGRYREEANKILKHYDLSVEELEKFITYDKSDRMDMKPRGAFCFALYLSQGDLTNAFKSLYQVQVFDISGEPKWVNNITNTELVYGYICDFIGSITTNKVLGMKHGGRGHTNAYFNKRRNTPARNCELIADYGAIIGCKEGIIAKKILKAFAPYTVNAIEAILKTQSYLNYKGEDNVNYI